VNYQTLTVELSGLRQLACLFALINRYLAAKSMTASKSAAAICYTFPIHNK